MGQSPVLKLSTVAIMAGGSVEAQRSGGGIAQDDARNRRTSSRSRPVGTTELPGKGFSIQKALRHGARNLHELDVPADEFALVDLGAPSLGPAPDPRNRHALDRPNAA